ncbi:hypothetical protein CWB41_00410 [Methylovirgula ligni]|uniref:Uncharacterized protein n=1 Tax=Methylovirgula ligni TaxID=569860 RepID=A0A3D9Z909_9HYPH|nr:hypothetical protein [Methylovirgula ligni]QAY94388.1 hypothetical protein CWB41_00410 [Methylovirgula ligni]REF87766.1 hypothetical protein DES32_1396 [Methylovirgula ligni]
MDEPVKRRYRIWELAKENLSHNAEPPPAIQVDELAAMMALYDYRPLIDVQLPGTLSRRNGPALNCKTAKISTDTVDLVYEPKVGQSADAARKQSQDLAEGTDVQLRLEKIGEVGGVITARKPEGLQVTLDSQYRPAMQNKLAHMAAEHAVAVDHGAAAQSPITKIEPGIKKSSFLDHTGTLREGTIVRISSLDALIRARIIPPAKSRIVLLHRTRQSPAEVTQAFEIAFAVKFSTPLE